jgi:hypothetical protein
MNSSADNHLNRKVLPPAVAVWAMLTDADHFLPELRRGTNLEAWRRYTVNLKFDREHYGEVEHWLELCRTTLAPNSRQLPWKQHGDGSQMLLATSGQRPGGIDALKNVIPRSVKVGSGSILKVYVTAQPYTGFGGGIGLHINSYQVLQLKSSDEDPFNMETGYLLPHFLDRARQSAGRY